MSRFRHLLDVGRPALHDDDFETIIVVQVDVQSRKDRMVIFVLKSRQLSAAMIGDMPLIGDARLLRFQAGILRRALQEVIFMFWRDSDSAIKG
jgi:hypothetical protein